MEILSARKTKKTVLKTFEGSTIIDYHQNVGDNVLGFGGVTFFDVNNKNNTLPRLFNNFHYFGDTRNLHPDQRLPRAEETLPLGNIDFIAEKAHFKKPYFLFINSPETHIPYDVPGTIVDNKYRDLV